MSKSNKSSKPVHAGDDEIPSQVSSSRLLCRCRKIFLSFDTDDERPHSQVIKEMHVAKQLQAELQEVATRVQSVRLLQQLQQEHNNEEDIEASEPRAKSAASLTMSPGGHRSPSLAGIRTPSFGILSHGSSPNASAGSKVWNDFR